MPLSRHTATLGDFIRSVFESLSDAVAVVDGARRLLWANAAWKQWLGRRTTLPWRRAEPDGDCLALEAGLTAVLEQRLGEYRHEFSSQTERGREWRLIVISRLEGTTPPMALVRCQDISDRKSAEYDLGLTHYSVDHAQEE